MIATTRYRLREHDTGRVDCLPTVEKIYAAGDLLNEHRRETFGSNPIQDNEKSMKIILKFDCID